MTNSHFQQLFNTMTETMAQFRIRNLRGAICEYMDENLQEELIKDMRQILEEECMKFSKMSNDYEHMLRRLNLDV